jgi:hypothetical protein
MSENEQNKPKKKIKVLKMGLGSVEVNAESDAEIRKAADIPASWTMVRSGDRVTAFPKIEGGKSH